MMAGVCVCVEVCGKGGGAEIQEQVLDLVMRQVVERGFRGAKEARAGGLGEVLLGWAGDQRPRRKATK